MSRPSEPFDADDMRLFGNVARVKRFVCNTLGLCDEDAISVLICARAAVEHKRSVARHRANTDRGNLSEVVSHGNGKRS